jgi:hypothetical protein
LYKVVRCDKCHRFQLTDARERVVCKVLDALCQRKMILQTFEPGLMRTPPENAYIVLLVAVEKILQTMLR